MLLEKISGALWGGGTMLLVLGAALLLTIRLRLVQFVRLREIFSVTIGSVFRKRSGEISQFQALSTVLAASMGTGNIAGVAAAITAGGSGAVLWMTAASMLCAAAAYAENYLGIRYADKNIPGAMAYIAKGLKAVAGEKAAGAAAAIYALACVTASLGSGSMSQSGAAADALSALGIPCFAVGVGAALMTAAVIFSGRKSAAKAAGRIIPLVSIIYIGSAIAVTAVNARNIPSAAAEMLRSAFGIRQAAAGFCGAAVKNAVQVGLKRGIFSNEAGMGSSVFAHSSSGADEETAGMWGIAEVFIDTVICCTLTAAAILCTGAVGNGLEGAEMISAAFSGIYGSGAGIFTAICTSAFAFAAIIGWYFYGEKSVVYLAGKRARGAVWIYRVIYAIAVYTGAVISMSAVWEITDICCAVMLFPNMAAVLMLSGEVKPPSRKPKKH